MSEREEAWGRYWKEIDDGPIDDRFTFNFGYAAATAARDAAWERVLVEVLDYHGSMIWRTYLGQYECDCGAVFDATAEWRSHIVTVCRERLAE